MAESKNRRSWMEVYCRMVKWKEGSSLIEVWKEGSSFVMEG